MNKKNYFKLLLIAGIFTLSGCHSSYGSIEKNNETDNTVKTDSNAETETENTSEADSNTETVTENTSETDSSTKTESESIVKQDTWDSDPFAFLNEDYTIDMTSDDLYANVSFDGLLKSKPVTYDRYTVDGYVFEWLESDYEDKDNRFVEDGVLLISKESNADDVQILHVKGEGAGGTMVDTSERFLYVDADFDGKKDILVSNGRHGAQGAMGYYCFLKTDNVFEEVVEFCNLPEPEIDAEHKVIHTSNRDSAVEHTEKEYAFQEGRLVEISKQTTIFAQ